MKCTSCYLEFSIPDHGCCPNCGASLAPSELRAVETLTREGVPRASDALFRAEHDRRRFRLARKGEDEGEEAFVARIYHDVTKAVIEQNRKLAENLEARGFKTNVQRHFGPR